MLIPMSEIKISSSFKNTHPSDKKIDACRENFKNSRQQDRKIVLNRNNVLVDGYVAYLVLKENGVKYADITYCDEKKYTKKVKHIPNISLIGIPTTYVFGKHYINGKEYVWRVRDESIADNIKVGDRVRVNTKFGTQTATVTRIEILDNPPVSSPIKTLKSILSSEE